MLRKVKMQINRKKRNKYPTHVEARVPMLRKLVRAQINKNGTEVADVWWSIGSDSKTTLVNRIHKGTLTLKDMLWISDYFPEVDWNSVIQRVREDRAILDRPLMDDFIGDVSEDEDVSLFLSDFGSDE